MENELYLGLVQRLLGTVLTSIRYVSQPHLTISVGRVHRRASLVGWEHVISGVSTLLVQLNKS